MDGELWRLADEELMQRAAGGDVRAFELIFDRHASIAYSLASRICSRRAMAEDAVQEAFLSLWRNSGRYEPDRGSVRSWVLSAVHNRAIDTVRRIRVRDARDSGDVEAAERVAALELTEAEVLRRDEARRVRVAIDQLPAEQRQVVELAYFDGYTHREIASVLELPEGTVKGRMRLALQKLRDLIDPEFASPAVAMPAGSPR
jgi:RNA polymerase sigma-70 factor, ECF subfamily